MPRLRPSVLLLVAWALALPACAPVVSPYSHTAYLQATSLKARSLRVMDRATHPYAEASDAVDRLQDELASALEYARGRPKNGFSTRQWETLLDPGGHLLGGFFTRWASEGSLNPVFIVEAKRIVGDAFDTISGLESGKLGAPPG